ncbi:MAG: hypothetical protein IAE78_27730, partial [Myxococcus sp.]|nr:hypothetical protein [Myxococcus sp.]
MPAPVVCPSCSRVFPATASVCPQCGAQADAAPRATLLGRVELTRAPARTDAPLELPPDPTEHRPARASAPPAPRPSSGRPPGASPPRPSLELPPDAPGPRGANPGGPLRPSLELPPDAPGPRGANPAGPLRPSRELPPDAPGPRGANPAGPPRPSLELPPDAPTSPAGASMAGPGGPTAAPPRSPDAGEPAAKPHAPERAAGLELPPDESPAPMALSPLPLPAEPSASAPRFEVYDASPARPAWLGEEIEAEAWRGLLLTVPLAALVAVDRFAAGRPHVSNGLLTFQLVVLLGAAAGLFLKHRAGLVAAVAGGLVGLASPSAATVGFLAWTAAMALIGFTSRARNAALIAGLVAVAALSPPLLDGVTTRPWMGEARALLSGDRREPVRWPFVDQHSGVQLTGTATLRPTTAPRETTRLFDASEGLVVMIHPLPSGLELGAATRASQAWLEAEGLGPLVFGTAEEAPGSFDAASLTPYEGQLGRARVSGLLRVGVLGGDAFAITAWTRAHRAQRLAPQLRQLVEGARYRPPARP